MGKLPEKILRIEELTFILPDDFNGNILDAIDLLVNHVKENGVKYLSDDRSTMASLLTNSENSKLCVKYGIFEKVNDQTYKLMDHSI